MTTNITGSIHQEEEYARQSDNYKGGEEIKKYKEKKGLTYPCIILEADAVPPYILGLLENLLVGTEYNLEEGYMIYIKVPEGMAEIGLLPKTNYNSILGKTFDMFDITLRMDKETILDKDLMYALVPPTTI